MCTGRTHSFEYWTDTNLSSNSQVMHRRGLRQRKFQFSWAGMQVGKL